MARETSDLRSVFINCPFDNAYSPLFDAIVFTVAACGLEPRSSLEGGAIGEPRLERITRALFASHFSIHDLTRCTGQGPENFARFNMPLELGLAMAHRLLSSGETKHEWMVMVPQGHTYARFISDLNGFDPARHDGTVRGVVTQVLSWLSERPMVSAWPEPRILLDALPRFEGAVHALRKQWEPADPPWREVVAAAKRHRPA